VKCVGNFQTYISTFNTQHMQSPDVITTGLYLATCFGR